MFPTEESSTTRVVLTEYSQYYVSQPLVYNSVHGSAAFILASLENEILYSEDRI